MAVVSKLVALPFAAARRVLRAIAYFVGAQ